MNTDSTSPLDLLLPSRCAVCGAQPRPICTDCAADLVANSAITKVRGARYSDFIDPLAHGLRFSIMDAAASRLLSEVKDRHLTAALTALGPRLGVQFDFWMLLRRITQPVLVPMPASRASWRARGFNTAVELAKILSANSRVNEVALWGTLEYSRQVEDQRGLGVAERARNLRDALVFKPDSPLPAGAEVILVDDVLTTGATLREAVRALTVAGVKAAGFVVFSETLLKKRPASS